MDHFSVKRFLSSIEGLKTLEVNSEFQHGIGPDLWKQQNKDIREKSDSSLF
jgi:hypothetical protein